LCFDQCCTSSLCSQGAIYGISLDKLAYTPYAALLTLTQMLAYSTKNVTTLESMEAPALGGEWFKNLIETQAYRIEIQWERSSSGKGQKQMELDR
jgi:hypothetical protein